MLYLHCSEEQIVPKLFTFKRTKKRSRNKDLLTAATALDKKWSCNVRDQIN